ncbi:membrane-spanning 4-domains subfamily A member 4A-like [Carettochelys insculpta]|uniref:membrane-spanning 4-domains subfamily A member 4A-like n=1 Tax=Carettochelys insculpta TaxID=44489 RepID=UPI003EBCEE66
MEAGPSGVVLLTQIIPEHQSSAQPRSLRKFYQGEPLALGITQILTSVMLIAFGIILLMADNHHLVSMDVGTPVWMGSLFIISGSLSVAAAKKPKISLVKAMLAMNIISAVLSGVGIILHSLSFVMYYPYRFCDWDQGSMSCAPASQVPMDTIYGVAMILLVFTILEFCVSISSAAFGCRTICRDSYSDTSVVIYQTMGPPAAPTMEAHKSPPPYQDCQTP